MAKVAGRGANDADDLESGEEDAADWTGAVPDDAEPWNKALHHLISCIYGDGQQTGVEPEWWTGNSDIFVDIEEERRGLPRGALQPFLRQPYNETLVTADYTSGRSAQVKATLFGSGEKLGDWDSFTLYYAKPDGEQLCSLECGQRVQVGEFDQDVVVTRILRGTKAAGRAEQNKTQHCYYALLKVGSEFHYAALQHLHYHGAPYIAIEWCEDVGFSGHGPSALAKQMAGFKPKSVSAVAKSAAKFASKSPSLKRKALKAQPEQSARARSKAVESDLESDESDGRESPDESGDPKLLEAPKGGPCARRAA